MGYGRWDRGSNTHHDYKILAGEPRKTCNNLSQPSFSGPFLSSNSNTVLLYR